MKLGTLLRVIDVNDAKAKFAELSKYGFTSCQLVFKPKEYTSADAAAIKQASADAGIEISAQFCGL